MDYSNDNQPPVHFEYQASHYREDLALSTKANAFQAIFGLEGICNSHKAGVLIDLILALQPDNIVEIGVSGGRSFISMAFALKANGKGKIFGIDPWIGQDRLFVNLNEKITYYDLGDQVELIRLSSQEAPIIPFIDLLHIDTQSDEGIYRDVQKWVPYVKENGIIILNNVTWGKLGTLNPLAATELLNQMAVKQAHFGDGINWAVWLKTASIAD